MLEGVQSRASAYRDWSDRVEKILDGIGSEKTGMTCLVLHMYIMYMYIVYACTYTCTCVHRVYRKLHIIHVQYMYMLPYSNVCVCVCVCIIHS